MTMKQFAEHVIAVTNLNGHRISNLQLQKIMYFVIGDYILDNGITPELNEMYTDHFEAWPYGPVIASEYNRFSGNGRHPIYSGFERTEEYTIFNRYILRYINEDIFKLVEDSHKHSRWCDNRDKISNKIKVEYTLENIRDDFRKANR